MKILLASSEAHPYSKTGGLADMVGALAKTLARGGHEVGLVTPLYAGIRKGFPQLQKLDLPLDLPLGAKRVVGEISSLQPFERLTVYFVEQPAYYQRSSLYEQHGVDYPDNAERFIFFSKAVAHLAMHLPWTPELLHVQDWQVGFAPLFIEHYHNLEGQGNIPRTCMTVHNLAYQGLFPAAQFTLTNLPWTYFTPAGVEFYGQMSCLKAGLAHADILTTVSPRYAREITTDEFGCGLDGLLRYRQQSLFGILNGVDYEEWNTVSNTYLKHSFDSSHLAGKTANKLELQRELELPVNAAVPLFGSIGRIVEQKGVDLLLGTLREMLAAGFQFVLLGTGTPAYEEAYLDLANRFPSQVGVRIGFDEALSHRIEAGCDFFLMPSHFEPCGLNQMYSLRYATIPIVRRTGGLDDTVTDATDDPQAANGIKFDQYSQPALAKAIHKALVLFGEPELLHHFRLNALAADFSWERTAAEYVKVYEKALEACPAPQGIQV